MTLDGKKSFVLGLAALAAPALAAALFAKAQPAASARAAAEGNRVFELRTYHTHPGRLDALNKRFREHTCRLFTKHGMQLVGFWTPQDDDKGKADTLVYLLAFPSREAAAASWKAFQNDPEWKAARDASEADGKIVSKVESVYLDPTDYSAIK
jgi:hypothetical protein